MSTFPTDLIPQAITARESRPTHSVQTRSGAIQSVWRGQHFFEFDIVWPPLTERNYRRLQSFVAQHSGIVTPFELVIPASEPLGTAAGTPVVKNVHSKGDTTVKTRGWFKRSKVLLEGDLVRIKQKVYRVTQRAKTDASGEVTLNIDPGLYQDANDGEGVVARKVSFRVRFLSSTIEAEYINTGSGIMYQTSATVREDSF